MATQTKYSELIGDVLPQLKADPSEPVMLAAIQKAVTQFCSESWVWRHIADPMDAVAGERSYDLEAPAGTDVAQLLAVAYDGTPLDPASTDGVSLPFSQTGTPRFYVQLDTESFQLDAAPNSDVAGALQVVLALQPSHLATSYPRWIANQYREQLAHGALARLKMMQDQPWTDMAGAEYYLGQFRAAISNARAHGVAGLARAPLRTRSQH